MGLNNQRSYHYPQANRDVIENKFRRVNTGAHPKHKTSVDPNSSKPGEPPIRQSWKMAPQKRYSQVIIYQTHCAHPRLLERTGSCPCFGSLNGGRYGCYHFQRCWGKRFNVQWWEDVMVKGVVYWIVQMGGNQVQSGLTVDLAQLLRGVPLHVWNSETFLKIGQTWGDVVLICWWHNRRVILFQLVKFSYQQRKWSW